MIEATVLADSISPQGHRLTTMELTFHRFILPEVAQYRQHARSSTSSRAIGVKRKIEEVRTNPAIPVSWGSNRAGMVAGEKVSFSAAIEASDVWLEAAMTATAYAEYLYNLNIHKEIANRVLEPFLWHTSVVSTTNWQHMFNQRIHEDAQPEFHVLALAARDALEASEPTELEEGEWSLPFITEEEKYMDLELLKKVSAARCARTSYGRQHNKEVEKDLEIFETLATGDHWVPMEHVATPSSEPTLGCFDGWRQMRHDYGG